jgi:hypothetical protein
MIEGLRESEDEDVDEWELVDERPVDYGQEEAVGFDVEDSLLRVLQVIC